MTKWVAFILLFSLSYAYGQEGIVSEVIVQENKRTKEKFLRKITRVKKGIVLDSTVLENDMIRLKRLPSTSHAYYQVHKKEDGTYKVVYGVQENFTLIPYGNFFTTNDDEFAFRVGVQEYNLLGQNITLGAFYQDDIFSSYGVNFKAPYLFSNKLGLALNYQNLTTQEPVFLDQGTADYKYNNTSYEIAGIYQASFNHGLFLGINFFTETYNYIEGATDASVPLRLEVDKLLYKGIYEYNGLNYYYQYVEGVKNTFNAQYVTAVTGDLPEFLIFRNDFTYFERIGEKGNWASRLTLGVASNKDSPFAPFAVDNNLNIRGVGNTIDRGTGAVVLNTEYRHTFYDKEWLAIQGNGFVDAGSWRNPGGDFGDFGDTQNLRVYPGLGLRFIHKRIFNTIFRIDYGYGITEDATNGFVFGIGQYF